MHSFPCSPCPQSSLALLASASHSSPAPKLPSLLSMHSSSTSPSVGVAQLLNILQLNLPPSHLSYMLCLRSFIHFISLCLQASTATCFTSLPSPSFITLHIPEFHTPQFNLLPTPMVTLPFPPTLYIYALILVRIDIDIDY